MSAIEQVTWVIKVGAFYNSSYIQCNSMQFYQNNPFSTTMELHYKYNHNVMLSLLIFIHPLNLTHGSMKSFGLKNEHLLWLLMMV